MVLNRNMLSDTFQIINESLSLVIAFILGIRVYSSMNMFSRLLFFQLCGWLLFYCLGHLVTSLQPEGNKNNHFIYNISLVFETTLLLLSAGIILKTRFKYLLILAFCGFTTIYLLHMYSQGIHVYALTADIYSSLVFSFIFTFVLYRLFLNESSPFFMPEFWMILGLLIYFACSIPYLSFFSFLGKQEKLKSLGIYHFINDNLSNIRYIMLAIGFWFFTRTKQAIKPINNE